jgi:PAS domain S-box-containing protein
MPAKTAFGARRDGAETASLSHGALELLGELIDRSDDAVIETDADGAIRHFNRSAERMFGPLAVDEHIADWLARLQVFSPDGKTICAPGESALARVFGGESIDAANLKVRPWNSQQLLSLRVSGHSRGAPGQARSTLACFRQLDRAAPGEHVYRQLFESSQNPIVVVDSQVRIVAANRQAEATLGGNPRGLVGQPVHCLLRRGAEPLKQPDLIAMFGSQHEVATRSQMGFSILRCDGIEVPVELLLTPVTGDDGPYFAVEFRDVSVESHAEANRSRLASIVDSSDDAIVARDLQGTITGWNAGAERVYGFTAAEAIGQDVHMLIPVDRSGAEELLIDRIHRREAVTHFETRRRRKEGAEVDVSLTLLPNVDVRGDITGYSEIARDIGERILAEQQLRQANAELERRVLDRTSELQHLNRALEQINHENGTFVYTVSHDLRSPLVNLQGFSRELGFSCQDLRSLLADPRVPADLQARGIELIEGEIAQSVDFILNGVARMDRIIDSLLQLSRIGRVAYRRQQVDVQTLVNSILAAMSGTIAEQATRVTVGVLEPCWGDSAFLERAFANLIANALKYLDPTRRGEITIGMQPPRNEDSQQDSITYFVQDNGLGLSETQLRSLFQPFQRFHPDVAPGEGMGLAIVRRVVDRHAGRTWAESVAGVGSTFYIQIPRLPADESSAL